MAYLIMGTYILSNIFMFFIMDRYPFGEDVAGPYSIYSSKSFFIVYHIWGIVLCILGMYALWKNSRRLFMITLFLLLLVMFYPWFTASPADRKQGQDQKAEKEKLDSIRKAQPEQPPKPTPYINFDSVGK